MRKLHLAGAASLAVLSALAADQGHAYERGRKDDAGGGDGPEAARELVREIRSINDNLAARDVRIAADLKAANDQIAATGAIAAETKASLAAQAEAGAALQARLTELEQRAARSTSNDNRKGGHLLSADVLESPEFKAALERGQSFKGQAQHRIKATIASTTGGADGAAGDLIRPDRLAEIIAPPDRTMTIRQLILPGRTSGNAIEYIKETGFTNNAATVEEGTLKPQSSLAFDIETVNVRTIAHWVLATKQILDDVPRLASYIDGRLRYGLAYVEEAQLLLGDGTGQNLWGIIPQATNFDNARSQVGDTEIDTIRRAMTQVRLAEYRPTGIVLHPADWERIELTKTDDGAYLFANPTALAGPRLWGLPVVETQAIPEGEFLVGAFNMGAQLFDREDTVVEISTEDSDNFRKNLVTIRAEERLALAVTRPESFVHGGFDGPTGSP